MGERQRFNSINDAFNYLISPDSNAYSLGGNLPIQGK
jgi:hypothetical protein